MEDETTVKLLVDIFDYMDAEIKEGKFVLKTDEEEIWDVFVDNIISLWKGGK